MFLNEYQTEETLSQFENRAYNFIWKKSNNFSGMHFKAWPDTTQRTAQYSGINRGGAWNWIKLGT